MNQRMVFPIRMRILVTLLLLVTAVVSVITYVMANLFHEDKTTYINDLASVMAQGTAQECGSLLVGYEEKAHKVPPLKVSALNKKAIEMGREQAAQEEQSSEQNETGEQ